MPDEAEMPEQPPITRTGKQARQGVISGRVLRVLLSSLVLVVVAMVVSYLVS